MSIMIFDELDTLDAAKTKIKVIGVGGGGKNAINHMVANNVRGVEFYAVNTDAADLKITNCDHRLLIGKTKTHGQGAGANPDVGRAAALESEDDIHEMIGDAQMVFITCGMGGGTGTGAAPIIGRIAREHGCLTVGVCTKPFLFEGPVRMENAVAGMEELRQYVDTLIVIPNQRLLQISDAQTSIADAFREADNVLRKAVQGIAEIIAVPGLINVDFADVKTVMANKGTALLGIGVGQGKDRAVEAARRAVHSKLLEVTIDGATHAIVNFTASKDVSMNEINVALSEIRNNAGKDLNVIWGVTINEDLGDEMVITVVATGYELKAKNSGYDDLADQIYRNMSSENITYEGLSSQAKHEEEVKEEVEENKLDEIFGTGMSKKQLRRQAKEEKKKKKMEDKMSKKQDEQDESSSNIPSWLRRK